MPLASCLILPSPFLDDCRVPRVPKVPIPERPHPTPLRGTKGASEDGFISA